MFKYILSLMLYVLYFSISGEHPAAMQHNAATASRSVSPAWFLVSCIGALWTFTTIASSSAAEWWPWPLTRRRCIVGHEIGAMFVGEARIYQRRRLNGELLRRNVVTRQMTSSRRPARRPSTATTKTPPTINSSTTTSAR